MQILIYLIGIPAVFLGIVYGFQHWYFAKGTPANREPTSPDFGSRRDFGAPTSTDHGPDSYNQTSWKDLQTTANSFLFKDVLPNTLKPLPFISELKMGSGEVYARSLRSHPAFGHNPRIDPTYVECENGSLIGYGDYIGSAQSRLNNMGFIGFVRPIYEGVGAHRIMETVIGYEYPNGVVASENQYIRIRQGTLAAPCEGIPASIVRGVVM